MGAADFFSVFEDSLSMSEQDDGIITGSEPLSNGVDTAPAAG